MLVGAGLMFVLMHGEVSADAEISDKELEVYCEITKIDDPQHGVAYDVGRVNYCKIKDLTCVFTERGEAVSCVKN